MSLILRSAGRLATFTQTLVGLPLVLDLLGERSFLLLSLFLVAFQTTYSTAYLACKNTRGAGVVAVLGVLGSVVTGLLVVLTFYLHVHPPQPPSAAHLLHSFLPPLWSSFLRYSSPLFTLLEGISSLLVIQALGRTTRSWIERGEREGKDIRGVATLVGASSVYVCAVFSLVETFPPPPLSSPYPPFFLGLTLATTFFLTCIGFRLRRTTVIETSFVLAYIAWSVWLVGAEGGWGPERADPAGAEWGQGWLARNGWAPDEWDRGDKGDGELGDLLSYGLRSVPGVVTGLVASLPLPLLIALIYRITVLHAASRIIIFIRRRTTGWEDPSRAPSPVGAVTPDELASRDAADGARVSGGAFWNGQKLSEEPPSARITTVILTYRRAILTAVYTHLLLLPSASPTQSYWRWLTTTLFLLVWAAELVLDEGESDEMELGVEGLGLGLAGGKEWKGE